MTSHTEAVIVYYDPSECSYEQLLDTFFTRVNPLTVNRQGNDFGKQYRTGVYPHTPEQMAIAKARFGTRTNQIYSSNRYRIIRCQTILAG